MQIKILRLYLTAVLSLCITDARVNITNRMMCYIRMRREAPSSSAAKVGSVYLCGRKIADIQLKAADRRLAENDGFFVTFHLDHRHILKLDCL